jgi:hypothetical protein
MTSDIDNEKTVVVCVDWMRLSCDLQPPADLLFIPHMIHKYGEPQWNDIDGGELKNLEQNVYQ